MTDWNVTTTKKKTLIISYSQCIDKFDFGGVISIPLPAINDYTHVFIYIYIFRTDFYKMFDVGISSARFKCQLCQDRMKIPLIPSKWCFIRCTFFIASISINLQNIEQFKVDLKLLFLKQIVKFSMKCQYEYYPNDVNEFRNSKQFLEQWIWWGSRNTWQSIGADSIHFEFLPILHTKRQMKWRISRRFFVIKSFDSVCLFVSFSVRSWRIHFPSQLSRTLKSIIEEFVCSDEIYVLHIEPGTV